jgi:molecular chaperone DnaK (HSP70)
MAGYRAAIDFGTSYTVATSRAGSETPPAVLALVDEGRLPSAVALDDVGRLQAGPSVEEVAALAPDRVERTPKRSLDQLDVMLGGEAVQTVDLVTAVMEYVRAEMLRQFNGRGPDELCLTHPAQWEPGDLRIQRVEAAARQAGFTDLRLLAEPCAAALALAAAGQLEEVGEGDLVAVYDLGGGTFDIALLKRIPGRGFELTGEPGGDQELGGEWLDDRLYERLSSQLPDDDERALRDPAGSPDPLRWQRAGFAFRQGIRRAKERLSREVSTRIALNPPFSRDYLTLTRAELELTAIPLINESAERFDLVLRRNGRTPADLAAICLVGGSSRLTVVNRIIGERFGRPVATHGDPKAVTALGALCEVRAAGSRSPRQPPEELYDDALAAFWTNKFDRAIELLEQVLVLAPDYAPAIGKLEQARRQQQLTVGYAQACAAADAADWERAVAGFSQVSGIDPGFLDVAVRLANAREQQQIAALRAEASRLYEARQWVAVINVADRLRAMDPDAAGLDDLMESAQAELDALNRAEQIAKDYRAALRMLEASAWQEAIAALERIARENPGYRDTEELLERTRTLAGKQAPEQPRPDAPGDIGQPAVVRTFEGNYASINSMVFSPDGRLLAASAPAERVRIWDASTGIERFRLPTSAETVLFSADGRWLVTSGKTKAQVWDVATERQLLSASHRSPRGDAVALTSDCRWMATGGPRNTVRTWDTGTGKALLTIFLSHLDSFTPTYEVAGLVFSPDGSLLAAASTDKTARVWEAGTGEPLLELGHGGAVAAVAFSPDGRWLATASADKTARIWDAGTGDRLAELPHPRAVRIVVFSPDGDLLATASSRIARIWALRGGAGQDGD